MTAPARQDASASSEHPAASEHRASEHRAGVGDDAAARLERRRLRMAWIAVIAVMVLATALTVAILLLQWMATSSGTVGR